MNNLNSKFVKEYYDSSLKNLDSDYSLYRWHRNIESKFDYSQTKKVLSKIVEGLNFDNVLEIGPGDGAWTEIFLDKSKKYTVLDQSDEMLKRIGTKFGDRIAYIKSDFLEFKVGEKFDALFLIRCFEYFSDKNLALRVACDLLNTKGLAVITTKNSKYIRSVSKDRNLHSGQISMKEMCRIAEENGFLVTKIIPTTLRVKSKYFLSRLFFSFMFEIGILLNSRSYNTLWDWAIESYTYVLQKKSNKCELFGVPGSGKTTFLNILKQKYFYKEDIDKYVDKKHFLFWFVTIVKESLKVKKISLIRFKLALLFNLYSKKGVIFDSLNLVDEGWLQRILSSYETKISEDDLDRIFESIDIPSKVYLISRDYNLCFKRYTHRLNNRTRLGQDYLTNWKKVMIHNFELIRDYLLRKGIGVNVSDVTNTSIL